MATRLTLATATRRLIDEEDEDNSQFTDQEIYDYINQAIRFLGTDVEWPFQTAEATSVEDQAVYTLPEDFISLLDVYFDNTNLTILERADLPALSITWQDTPSGTPRYVYKSDNAKFGLYPQPNAANAGLTLQIQYVKIPPDIESDTAKPDLHPVFNDCLPFYAAYLCHTKMGNIKQAEQSLVAYEFHKKRLVSKVQRFSDDRFRFVWSRKGY